MKSAMYFEETQALMQTFSQEDQAYFQDLWDYFNFAGFLYKEKALREQVYNLALDFSQAGADGLTAKDYFGLDPKGMADQIIENMPKESTRSVLKYGAIFSGIVIFYRLLSDFASQAHHFGTPSCWDHLLSPSSSHFCGGKNEKSNLCSICSSSRILFCR